MSLTVTHEPDADRYAVHDDTGALQGFIVYDSSPGVLRLIHAEVPPFLRNKGVVPKLVETIKILGEGELTKKLTIKAHRASETAKAKIQAAGGSIEIIETTVAPNA